MPQAEAKKKRRGAVKVSFLPELGRLQPGNNFFPIIVAVKLFCGISLHCSWMKFKVNLSFSILSLGNHE